MNVRTRVYGVSWRAVFALRQGRARARSKGASVSDSTLSFCCMYLICIGQFNAVTKQSSPFVSYFECPRHMTNGYPATVRCLLSSVSAQSCLPISYPRRRLFANRFFYSFRIARESDPKRQFSISQGGELTVAQPLDREDIPYYNLRIEAFDEGDSLLSIVPWARNSL